MKKDQIINYDDIVKEEGLKPIRGMYFDVDGKNYGLLLMNTSSGAKYSDSGDNSDEKIIYEGHNLSQKNGGTDVTLLDQPMYNKSGTLTENGKFYEAAMEYKKGGEVKKVRVYQKIKTGTRCYRGLFNLVDSWLQESGKRKVFRFELEPTDIKLEKKIIKPEIENKPKKVKNKGEDIKSILYISCKSINNEIFQIGYAFYDYDPKNPPQKIDIKVKNYSIDLNIPGSTLGISKNDIQGHNKIESDIYEIMFYLLKVDYIIGYNLNNFLSCISNNLNKLGQYYDFNKLKIIDLKDIQKSNSLEDLFNKISSTKTKNYEQSAKKDIKLIHHIVNTQAKNWNIFDNIKNNITDCLGNTIPTNPDETVPNNPNKDNKIQPKILSDIMENKREIIRNSIYFSLLNNENHWGDDEEALDLICTIIEGKDSIFLTGKAGTGKSTLIRDIIDCAKRNGREPIVTGTTGMAAVNIGGQTIHSFFELGISQIYYKKMLDTKKSYKLQESKIVALKKAPFVVIDEVSMLRSDILDCLNVIMTKNIGEGNGLSFGGKQIIFVGDIFQLAPIPAREMKGAGDVIDKYESPRFFDSDTFSNKISLKDLFNTNSFPYRIIELRHNHRNIKDKKFSEILDRIRDRKITQQDIDLLNTRVITQDEKKILLIATLNRQVNYMNDKMMSEIKNEEHTYEATMGGIPPHSIEERMGKSITVKKGARIMLTNNDSQKRWYTGSMATIQDLNDDFIKIKLDKDGKIYDIERVTVYNMEFRLEGGEWVEKKIGRYRQFPIRIAYAITVHKSQGATYDQIQANLSYHFAGGQSYVCISRVKNLKGLFLLSPVSLESFYFDPRVIEFKKFMDAKIIKDKEEISKKLEKTEAIDEHKIIELDEHETDKIKFLNVKPSEKRYIFELKKGSYIARGKFYDNNEITKKGKFIILEGSTGASKLKSSLTEYRENTVELRNAYIGEGCIIQINDIVKFKNDCTFHSPIEAANIIIGTSGGKLSDWKNLRGEVLSEKLMNELCVHSDKNADNLNSKNDISEITCITPKAEKYILLTNNDKLNLNNLVSVTDNEMALIAKFKGKEIIFGSLQSLSTLQSFYLSEFKGTKLSFPGIKSINERALGVLCNFGGYRSELDLSGLTNLSFSQCVHLSQYKGNLNLSGIEEINDAIAETLGGYRGRFLDLSGIQTITNIQYEELNKKNINLSEDINIVDIEEDNKEKDSEFDFLGINKITGTRYDGEGFDRSGYNSEGINRKGYDRKGNYRGIPSVKGYDIHGYDEDGYDEDGFNMYGFDREGYNTEGRDSEGYDRGGYNINGYDRFGHFRGRNAAYEAMKRKRHEKEIRKYLG